MPEGTIVTGAAGDIGQATVEDRAAMKRLAAPAESTSAILFLLSDDAALVTGENPERRR